MKTILRGTLKLLGTILLFIAGIHIFASFTPANQKIQKSNPLPLKPTKKIEFTTSEVTWMSLDVSPDGKAIVFEILGDLYTVSIKGGKATQITSGMAHDSQPRYSPDGKRIVFVSDRSGSENLWILDVGLKISDTTKESESTGLKALTKGKDTSFSSPEWSPDGKYVVASRTDRFTWIDVNHTLWIYHIDGDSGVQLTVEGDPIYGLGPAFGNDNRYLYTAHRVPRGRAYGHQIYRFDRDSGEFTQLTNQTGGAVRPALSSDGKWMVYGSRYEGQTGYRLRDLRTETETWLSYPAQPDLQEGNWRGTSSDHMPGYAYTPDNKAILTSIDGRLFRIEVPSGQKTEIPFEADVSIDIVPVIRFNEPVPDGLVQVRQIRWPSLSPDGSKLLFTAVHKLFVKDLSSGKIKRIVEMEDVQSTPAWSNDGQWIAFVTWSDFVGGHVYKVDSDGQNLKRLSQISAFYNEPAWTPSNREIVVAKGPWQQRGPGMRWVRIPSLGGEAIDVGPVRGSHPHFISNSDRLFYYSRSDGLVSMKLDGTDQKIHLKVIGQRPALGPGGPQPVDEIIMGPNGKYALVYADYNIYRVIVPSVGKSITLSVTHPSTARFPVWKLNILGGHFMSWGPNGEEATWSLGDTLFRYSFAQADENETYEPEQMAVELEFPRQKGKGTVVFRGARVLTMEPGVPNDGIIENGAVVVVNNRISEVGPSSSITTPSEAREIDVTGMVMLPGFIDLHTHWQPPTGVHRQASWEYLNYLAFGVTTTRNPFDPIDNLTYGDLVEMGEMVGPRIYSTGPAILNNTNILSLEDARNVVRRYREYYKHNNIKQYLSGDRTTRQLISMAAQEFRATPTTEGSDTKLMITQIFDGYSLEHLLLHCPLFKDVVELVAQSGTFYDPTVIVGTRPRSEYYYWTRTDVRGNPKVRRFTPRANLDISTLRSSWFHDIEFNYKDFARQLKKIVEAGGKVGVGSHGEMEGISYHWEIWNVQSGAMSEMDALRCATIFGAEAIGFDQDLGSIKEGKMADLLVLKKNPLDDIRNTTSLRYVMKNGLLYDADTLGMLWPIEKKLHPLYWQTDKPERVKN